MVAVPRVVLSTLGTAMLELTLISKAATQRAVVEGASATTAVLECSDSLPLLCRHALISRGLARSVLLFVAGVAEHCLGLLELGLLPRTASLVLASFGRRLKAALVR